MATKDTAQGLITILNILSSNNIPFDDHIDYPRKPGLYAIFKDNPTVLEKFNHPQNILYIGKAEYNLAQRDLKIHFSNEHTGSSTLRRTLGAVLKETLNLQAFTRNGKLTRNAINHYTFSQDKDYSMENKLTSWMKKNLRLGYWEYHTDRNEVKLVEIERRLIDLVVPAFNIDSKTSKINNHAVELLKLRKDCRLEAVTNLRLT